MGYYTNNGGLVGSGAILEPTGVHDIIASGLLAEKTIFGKIKQLATELSFTTVPSSSNLQSVQSLIESADESFNVFAVIGPSNLSESLTGTGIPGGKRTHTAKGFNYNTSSSNILSTGNTIVDMTGGSSDNLSVIENKKWMAMAQFDGTNFDGILLWIFTGDRVANDGTITSGARSVTSLKDVFYPDGVGSSDYHHFFPIAIAADGTIYSNTNSGKCGWNFSNGASPGSTTGYNSTTKFSSDDGIWGFIIPTGTNSAYVDGNAPGANMQSTSSTTPGFGIGNYDSSDGATTSVTLYWNGSTVSNTNALGFVFSGDG